MSGYVDLGDAPARAWLVREMLVERYGTGPELERERRRVRSAALRALPPASDDAPGAAGVGELRLARLAAALEGADPASWRGWLGDSRGCR